MIKRLVALPFLAFALIAAKEAPVAQPAVSMTPPAEVAADPANKWTLELSNGGRVVIQLRPDVAPQHVYRIQQLTTNGFYNGLAFHRVIPGFMAQGGDPQGTGAGGSPMPDLPAEFNDLPHLRGVVSMARTEDPNSANSQFFIMLAPRFSLDHKYSAFGRVAEGMAAVDGIAVGEPPDQPTKIVRASIGGPLPAPPAGALTAAVPVGPAPVTAVPEAVAGEAASLPPATDAILPAEPAAAAVAPESTPSESPPVDTAPDQPANEALPEAEVAAPDGLIAEEAEEEADAAGPDAMAADAVPEAAEEEAPTPE